MYIQSLNRAIEKSYQSAEKQKETYIPGPAMRVRRQSTDEGPAASGACELLSGGLKFAQSPKSVKDYNEKLRNAVEINMRRLGITLGEGEELELAIGGDNLIRVSGLMDADRARTLEEAMNTAGMAGIAGNKENEKIKKNLYASTFYINSAYAGEADTFEDAQRRILLIALKNTAAQDIKRRTGVDIDLSQLYYQEDGSIAGYPEGLSWIFNCAYNYAPKTDADKQAYSTATFVKHAINQLLGAGYHAIPHVKDLGVSFKYTAGDFPMGVDVQI